MGFLGKKTDKYYYDKASAKFRNKKYLEAIKYYDKALEINPNFASAWNDKGVSLSRLGKYSQSIFCFDRALNINSDHVLALLNKALNIYSNITDNQRYGECLRCYNRLLQLDEDSIKEGISGAIINYSDFICRVWTGKGLLLAELGNYDESIPCYDNALKINPNYYDALKNKNDAEIQVRIIKEEYDLAKKHAQIEKQIRKNGYNVLIDNFAKKYSDNYSKNEFKKLEDLMKLKGLVVPEKLLKSLILKSVENQDYISFKERIIYNSPKNIDEYIVNYVEIYGEIDTDNIDFLKNLFKEQGYTLSKKDLIDNITNRKKELELLNFEKNLLVDEESISIDEIDELSGYEFEVFTKILFENMGYESSNTKLSGDQGADLVVKKFGEITVVQAKRYNNKVTNSAIQEVVASIKHYNAHNGAVITNNEFTDSAIELANSNDIDLIDRHKLSELIDKYPVSKSYLEKLI